MTSLSPQSQAVKQRRARRVRPAHEPQSHPPTTLVPLLFRRKGLRDEIVYAPLCAGCGKPVLNLEDANVCCVEDNWEGNGEVLLNENGLTVTRLGTIPASVYHKGDCDSGGKPWTGANYVFRVDQRSRLEKAGRV
jgi:hypothetical protein